MADPNYPAGNNQELTGHDTARSLGPHFGIIPRWVNGLDLAGGQFKVLSVIACQSSRSSRSGLQTGSIPTCYGPSAAMIFHARRFMLLAGGGDESRPPERGPTSS
jgi:hypothetical protein